MKKHILVVDDDSEITTMMEQILRKNNYEVTVSHDGPHAIEQSHKHRIDLILLDIRMPFFSGFWFCDAFKKKPQTRNIPIVIVSGLLDEEQTKKAHELGARACLKKPFTAKALLDVIEKAVA